MLVSQTRVSPRQTIDFSQNRTQASQAESKFGRDTVDVGRGESSSLPKGVAQATSGWLGNGGCLDFTGSAVEVKSTLQDGQTILNYCTAGATDVKSGFVTDSGLFMQCMTGAETEVKSTLQDGQTILNYCTAGTTDVKSNSSANESMMDSCLGGAADVKSRFVTDSGLFMQCMTGANTEVKSGAPLSSF